LEAETNKYCPGGNDIGAISNLITWVLNFFLSASSPGWKTRIIMYILFKSQWSVETPNAPSFGHS
jgi:hypothetical protein